MFIKFVTADLIRNPRRTLSTAIGVLLGTGLFCAVLFFVDGLSASMTQRAVAPLPIDKEQHGAEQASAKQHANRGRQRAPWIADQVGSYELNEHLKSLCFARPSPRAGSACASCDLQPPDHG